MNHFINNCCTIYKKGFISFVMRNEGNQTDIFQFILNKIVQKFKFKDNFT